MKEMILASLKASLHTKEKSVLTHTDDLLAATENIRQSLVAGGKLLIFGNGGSAADAQHIAAEFVNRFLKERRPLAAMALTTDTSVITSIGNDYHFDQIFQKQVEALGRIGDIAVGISTSGNSPNVVLAMETARKMGLFTIGFTGRGGAIATLSDILFTVPSDVTARIQETHITLAHILCELVEERMFGGVGAAAQP
ncbi:MULTISPECIES: D-sedoheptulose-7-phosphate isomerase [Desulfococcus]|jgi:D-sedoheptulose 7-phosphate isomerase|uniref:Phosphoheptose isomerase n=1 Tax=Desulfococcus multivorans DSM 2059 TaxID=1121405 RepID=S7TRD3_DESML|nr:D-sedoheptulose 7-phosphate isomerase [Desulfococcus multivorans]AOY60596.1 GmhA: phosphoheptose isomerase [Desulfococcus multivorans]AQV02690.1 phosphoheptose isomerase [Desulfococcus multivorans]EPR39697.1 Phosphoheptose isomerase [Desulfococcus multivorans DSM 2059]MDX9819759.1 D-sedoheptulose 7-phosphate isomerase [Desulfococcus multivorans]SKA04280.1 phosphoheptose isomerase [Desulfococcus multivorans DSM 2059]